MNLPQMSCPGPLVRGAVGSPGVSDLSGPLLNARRCPAILAQSKTCSVDDRLPYLGMFELTNSCSGAGHPHRWMYTQKSGRMSFSTPPMASSAWSRTSRVILLRLVPRTPACGSPKSPLSLLDRSVIGELAAATVIQNRESTKSENRRRTSLVLRRSGRVRRAKLWQPRLTCKRHHRV